MALSGIRFASLSSARRFSTTNQPLWRATKAKIEAHPFYNESREITDLYAQSNRTTIASRMRDYTQIGRIYENPNGYGLSMWENGPATGLSGMKWFKVDRNALIPSNLCIIADNPDRPNHRILTNTEDISLSEFEKAFDIFGAQKMEYQYAVINTKSSEKASKRLPIYVKGYNSSLHQFKDLKDAEKGMVMNAIIKEMVSYQHKTALHVAENYKKSGEWMIDQLPMKFNEDTTLKVVTTVAHAALLTGTETYRALAQKNPEIYDPEFNFVKADCLDEIDAYNNLSLTIPDAIAPDILCKEPFERLLPPFTDTRFIWLCIAYRGNERWLHDMIFEKENDPKWDKTDTEVMIRTAMELDRVYYKLWRIYDEEYDAQRMQSKYEESQDTRYDLNQRMQLLERFGGDLDAFNNSSIDECRDIADMMSTYGVLSHFVNHLMGDEGNNYHIDASLNYNMSGADKSFISWGVQTFFGQFEQFDEKMDSMFSKLNDEQQKIVCRFTHAMSSEIEQFYNRISDIFN